MLSYCREVLKKWYVILFCAVLGAASLYYEKETLHPPLPETGDMAFIRIIQLDEIPTLGDATYGQEIDVARLLYTWPNMADFLSHLEEQYEMGKLSAEWDKMDARKKIQWDSKHFVLQRVGPGTYEITVNFTKKDSKDREYVLENGNRLLDSYQDYFQKKATMLISNSNLHVLKNYSYVEKKKIIDRSQLSRKYGVIGFILGGMVGLAAVTAWISRKKLG